MLPPSNRSGTESSRTVDGLLALMLWHLEIHAKQLAEGPV